MKKPYAEWTKEEKENLETSLDKLKNPAAVALGKLAKGRPKKYSKEELAKRTARLPHAKGKKK